MCIARTTDNLVLRLVALSYVAVIRNMPPLVFIFIFYFFVSSQIMPILGLGALAQGASPEVSALLGWLFGPTGLIENFAAGLLRSEEHTSELQSLMRISYAVFCLKKKHNKRTHTNAYKHNKL